MVSLLTLFILVRSLPSSICLLDHPPRSTSSSDSPRRAADHLSTNNPSSSPASSALARPSRSTLPSGSPHRTSQPQFRPHLPLTPHLLALLRWPRYRCYPRLSLSAPGAAASLQLCPTGYFCSELIIQPLQSYSAPPPRTEFTP